MRTLQLLAAATILATSSAVSADWDMPFFGDNNNSNSNMNNDGTGSGSGNGAADGSGDAQGSFSFGMNASGKAAGKGKGNSNFDGKNSYSGTNGYYTGDTVAPAKAAQ